MSNTLRLSIRNASVRLRTVRLEPWGREFLLTLDKKLEVTAEAKSTQARFRLMEADDRTLVFVEGCTDVIVLMDGATHNLDLQTTGGKSEPVPLSAQRTGQPMWDRDLDI